MSASVMWPIIEDVSREIKCVAACSVPTVVFGMISCSFARDAFASAAMTGVDAMVWWFGIACLSISVGLIERFFSNNRHRNSMYSHAFEKYEHIKVSDISAPLLWRSLCGGCHVQYDEELLETLVGIWEESLDRAGLVHDFSVISYERSKKLARELGIADMVEAVRCGVPVEDVFC